MDKTIVGIVGVSIVILGGVIVAGSNSRSSMEKLSSSFTGDDATVVADGAVHWHPKLSIVINGETRAIPADVGIGTQYANQLFYDDMMGMTDVHTHDASGTLHWEVMQGPVKKGHAKLKVFFDVWGQPFDREQLMERTNGPDGSVRMTVNGQPNDQFEQYVVQDGDEIELRYE